MNQVALNKFNNGNPSYVEAARNQAVASNYLRTSYADGNTTVVATSSHFSQARKFKVIVIGDSNVGKTTLTYRFCKGKFLEASESTIGIDCRTRTVNIDGENITLELWDTAGQERFRHTMVPQYYRNTHAIVFVYDVTDPTTFDSLKKWIEYSDFNALGDVPRILVGNKCDGITKVTTNVAQKFADQHNMPLFETSARLDSHCDNVEAIFKTLAHKLKDQKHFMPPVLDNALEYIHTRSKEIHINSIEPQKKSYCNC